MSDQNFYGQPADGHQPEALPSTNPWSTEQSAGSNNQPPTYGQAPSYSQGPPQQQTGGYSPPPGPPPGQQPQRAPTFKESDFVPESERGEQREAMEQFELNKSGNESQQDRDVAQLQREFPNVEGSLISALYSDTQSLGPTREMLQELASST